MAKPHRMFLLTVYAVLMAVPAVAAWRPLDVSGTSGRRGFCLGSGLPAGAVDLSLDGVDDVSPAIGYVGEFVLEDVGQ